MAKYLIFSISVLFFFLRFVASEILITAHDELKTNGFPMGLLPTNVLSYSLNRTSGDFSVNLGKTCKLLLPPDNYLATYSKKITGKLIESRIGELKGIRVWAFFQWWSITGIGLRIMALRNLLSRRTLGLGFNQARGLQTFTLPDLAYDYGALEPAISGEIMQIHHQKHHQAYITNYNKALEQLEGAIAKGDASTVVKLQSAIKFNGGGHVNHSIFWKNLTPISEGGGEPPKGSLGGAIDTHFGSFEALVQKVNAEGAALQGSGWVWLGLNKDSKKLVVETTANQDPLVTKVPSLIPLLGIDVWEHAYYLQYKNVRPDYLKNIWKVINWKYANEVYEKEC